MFTRCPECETTFRLGAQDLRRAGGKVRCGECETVFNALEYLEEEAEHITPASNPWQTGPADDESGEPDDGDVAQGPHEVSADTLYDDDYEGPIGEPAESQSEYPGAGAEADFNADTDSGDERWPTFEEEDDDDDIVSFITPLGSTADYPEVSPAVSAAIGIGQNSAPAELDDEDASLADEDPSWSDGPDIAFDDALDTSAADNTVEFIISGDIDETGDTEAQFVPVLGADDDDDDDVEHTDADDNIGQPAVTGANDHPDDGIDEFDDTIWERIPGVGASETAAETPLFANSGPGQADSTGDIATDHEQRREPVIVDETRDADTTRSASPADEDEETNEPDADAENLEFNAPADTWSSIFSRATRAARRPSASGDTQPLPVIAEDQVAAEAEELDAWSRELQVADVNGESEDQDIDEDADAVVAADDRTDWVSELDDHGAGAEPGEEQAEWLAEAGEDDHGKSSLPFAADLDDREDWVTEQNDHGAATPASQQDPVPLSRDAGSTPDQPEETAAPDVAAALSDEHNDSIAAESERESVDDRASLTAAFATGEYDEEEYDVQHIVLADESEPDPAGLTQAFAVAGREEIPSWQPDTPEQSPAQNARGSLWLIAGLLVVATLALQLVHYNRDALAGSKAWGEAIRGVYQSLGMELYPNWSLDDYEIRGSEAIAGESGPDIMDIRAQVAAIGKEPIGLPHIRVVLRDRWSNPVAAKTVGPAEYAMPDSVPPDALLQPNETLAAHVSIIDPGSGAQGFELELCLPRRHTGLECTGRPFE